MSEREWNGGGGGTRTEQNRTEQNRTEQNRTEQNRMPASSVSHSSLKDNSKLYLGIGLGILGLGLMGVLVWLIMKGKNND